MRASGSTTAWTSSRPRSGSPSSRSSTGSSRSAPRSRRAMASSSAGSTASSSPLPTTPTTALLVRLRRPARGRDRPEAIMARLARAGDRLKPYLPSIHLQPYWRERFGTGEGMFPVSEDASRRSLALPFHTRLRPAARACRRRASRASSEQRARARKAPTCDNQRSMVGRRSARWSSSDSGSSRAPTRSTRSSRCRGGDRGGGRRTRVWVEGSPSRSSPPAPSARSLRRWGCATPAARSSSTTRVALAERIVEDAGKGRVDLADLGRRARRLLESTAKPARRPTSCFRRAARARLLRAERP